MSTKTEFINLIRGAMSAAAAGNIADDVAAAMLSEIVGLFATLIGEAISDVAAPLGIDIPVAGLAAGEPTKLTSPSIEHFACVVIAAAISQAQLGAEDPKLAAVTAAEAFRAGLEKLGGNVGISRASLYRMMVRARGRV